jgi:hypothetical protein
MKFRLFYLDYPFKKLRIYLRFPSVLTGDFNHFQTKLCETKPNSEMLKMNLTPYMTKNCKRNSEFLPMGKQTQTKPNLSASAGKFALSVVEGPICKSCPPLPDYTPMEGKPNLSRRSLSGEDGFIPCKKPLA